MWWCRAVFGRLEGGAGLVRRGSREQRMEADALGLSRHAAAARPRSLYVTMPDGCRLAADVYLPSGAPQQRVPAILIFTPYYRRFALTSDAPRGSEACPGVARWRDLFVPRGYALVAIDVRGTGASFGTRDSFRSPRERDDYARIAEWVTAQPWS